MIPPLFRRCPDCGHRDLSRRFRVVEDTTGRRAECPSCGHRFTVVDDPKLL
jgi:DNA-directed RNA polymerase subunit RPC12/RpoP